MVIPTPSLGLIPNVPSFDDFGGILSIIRAGELRDLGPAFQSVRSFARAVGMNESTLRTAYLTEGRKASTGTQLRLDAAIRQNVEELLGRRYMPNSVIDKQYGSNPLARLYLQPPPNVRRMRIIVRLTGNEITDYQGGNYGNGYYTVTLEYTQRAFRTWEQLRPVGHEVDTIIWQYEQKEEEISLGSVD